MHKLKYTILLIIVGLTTSCHPYEEWDNTAMDNFEVLWTTVDQHYCFFDEKQIDWDEVHDRYKARLQEQLSDGAITQLEFFDLCSAMINELKDGHINLITPFDLSSYQEWWTNYPQDFNWRVVQEFYLNFDYRVTSGIIYKILPDNIGYLYYPSFSNKVGEGNLDFILSYLSDCKALIIDIRNNGGGEMTNINTFVSRFITEPMVGAYIMHKTGPKHDQFSSPYPIEYKPADKTHVCWKEKPIAVLTNRSCFSAANDFVSVMKQLPQVKIIGAKTGGGGGIPFNSELPIGWKIRFSACPVTDKQGNSIESGVEPSPNCEVHCDKRELGRGKDNILDFAIASFCN